MYAFLVPVTMMLVVVFAASAFGKLRSADRGAATFAALRIAVPNPRRAAGILVLVEVLVAVGLLVSTGPVFVASAAAVTVLTAGMLVAVVRAHRLGVTDDCGCFGEWMPSAIGPRLIVRNVLLLVSATLVLLSAGAVWALSGVPVGLVRAFGSAAGTWQAASALIATGLVAAIAWTVARSSAPGAGDPAPRGSGAVVLAETRRIVDLLAPGPRARLIVFVAPGCHACRSALSALESAGDRLTGLVDVYVAQRATEGTVEVIPSDPLPVGARYVIDVGGSLAASLAIGAGTPVAALIGTDGRQAGPLAVGSDEVARVVDSILVVAEAPTT